MRIRCARRRRRVRCPRQRSRSEIPAQDAPSLLFLLPLAAGKWPARERRRTRLLQKFLARQPIFTSDRVVYGYELLFRASLENFFSHPQGDVASASIAENFFLF